MVQDRYELFSNNSWLQGFVNPCLPRAAFGCGRSSLNPYSAICWPSPLSAEELLTAWDNREAETLALTPSTPHDSKEKAPPSTGSSQCMLPLLGLEPRKHVTANLTPWDLVPFPLLSHHVASDCPIPSQGPSFLPYKVRRWTGRFPRPRPALAFCEV